MLKNAGCLDFKVYFDVLETKSTEKKHWDNVFGSKEMFNVTQ